MYKPTANAVGDLSKPSTVSGFAKLSDAAINAISADRNGYFYFKLEDTGDKDQSVMFVRTKAMFDDTTVGFGWLGQYDLCNTADVVKCNWKHANVHGIFFESEEAFENNCKRWTAEYSHGDDPKPRYSGMVNCYEVSGTHRCFSKGKSCYHAPRDHVTIYKWSPQGISKPVTTAAVSCLKSCSAIKQSDPTANDGVYSICPDGKHSSKISVYCDQTTQGGGWMLMLTQDHATEQYAKSVNPLTQNLNVDKPSPLSRYSRDWSKTGIASPLGGSEFLLKRGTSGEFVRFVQGKDKKFCGFGHQTTDCNNDNVNYHHGYYTEGAAYDQDNKLLSGIKYFNGCNYGGECDDSGVDGIGFGSFQKHLRATNGDSGYGVTAWPGGLRWNSATADSGKNVPYTYWYREACLKSCSAIKQSDPTANDGVYSICPDGKHSSKISVYCDQTTQGGGWMLMLTQDHATEQYAKSVNPLTQNLNVDKPSPLSRYSRDWSKTGIASPLGGSEFLLKRGTSGEFVRFVQGKDKKFCGFGHQTTDCNNDNVNYHHGYYTEGAAYDQDNKLLSGIKYFNGCNYGGGCRRKGVDGIGFGSLQDHLRATDGDRGYGVTAWPGGLRWNSKTPDSGKNVPYTYWYREAPLGPDITPGEFKCSGIFHIAHYWVPRVHRDIVFMLLHIGVHGCILFMFEYAWTCTTSHTLFPSITRTRPILLPESRSKRRL